MDRSAVRERVRAALQETVQPGPPSLIVNVPAAPKRTGVDGVGTAGDAELHSDEVHRQQPLVRPHERAVRRRLRQREGDARFRQELEELREVHDLEEIDDDVERAATLYEWQAQEHAHRPKSMMWYAGLAAATTAVAGLQILLFANFFGAITLGLIGGFMYVLAQQPPNSARYRIMIDGVAINSLLYHWRDLHSFNVIYQPGEVKTVIFRGQRMFSPHFHMEIGDADPVEIRHILLEFLAEDQDMEEPFADVLARRLGF